MKKNYNVNYESNTVTLTADFLRKASTLGTKEYNEMMQLRRDLTGFTFVKATASTTNRKANAAKNMNYKNMQAYIEASAANAEEAAAKIATFEKVQRLSKIQSNPFKYVLDWFNKEYPDCKPACEKKNSAATSNNSEDVEEAAKAIA